MLGMFAISEILTQHIQEEISYATKWNPFRNFHITIPGSGYRDDWAAYNAIYLSRPRQETGTPEGDIINNKTLIK